MADPLKHFSAFGQIVASQFVREFRLQLERFAWIIAAHELRGRLEVLGETIISETEGFVAQLARFLQPGDISLAHFVQGRGGFNLGGLCRLDVCCHVCSSVWCKACCFAHPSFGRACAPTDPVFRLLADTAMRQYSNAITPTPQVMLSRVGLCRSGANRSVSQETR